MKILKTLIEGGQTWAHRLRMLSQVLRLAFLGATICSTVFLAFALLKMPILHYKAAYYHLKGQLFHSSKSIKIDPKFWAKVNQSLIATSTPYYTVSSSRVIAVTQPYYDLLSRNIKRELQNTGSTYSLCFLIIIIYFLIRGKRSKRQEHLSGLRLVSSRQYRWRLFKERKCSDLRIGNIPILKHSERQHFLVAGSSGTGKSTCLRQLIQQIRKRGERGVIVDTTGDFLTQFYRPGHDILFNPFDSRSALWHPWCECIEPYHFDHIVNSLLPITSYHHDDFFIKAGRAVLTAALKESQDMQDDIQSVLDFLLKRDNYDLHSMLNHTDASIYLDPAGERTTVSVRATINNIIRSLRPLKNTKNPFSIRKWVLSNNRGDDRWLFISCTPDQRQTLIPLMTVWFSIALTALKAKSPSQDIGNLWYFVDELHSLQKLECLEESLAELRKYGGCITLATQDVSQLDKIYGVHATKTILDLCATKVCFRQNDLEIARRMSGLFGEYEAQETQEGISYGAHQMRDGVTLSKVKRSQPAILPSEFLALNDLEGFLKPPGNYEATKVKIKLK